MNRRCFVAGLLSAGAVSLAGCAGDDGEWDPSIGGDTPTISRGDEATVTVEATDIGGFTFRPPPDGITLGLSDSERDVSPSPDSGEDSYPPTWFWSGRTIVTVMVPVAVAKSVETGEYQYGVTVYPDADSERSVRESFSVTVTDG
ncbi:hypothetical protein ABNG03_13830 [Halorubrum sp. RMP-47]|uniref:Uncharacterized protein n=1 Tax=Halorubrum miltondacostae TaxID=3076378 RepID=A0ABD5M2D5_9EURY